MAIAEEPYDSKEVLSLIGAYRRELAARLDDPSLTTFSYAGSRPEATIDRITFVARDGDEAIGCIGMRRFDVERVEVKHLWVRDDHRRSGVGHELLAAVEARARSLGYRYAVLDSDRRLLEALALYRREGYEETAPYNDNSYAQVWFKKPL